MHEKLILSILIVWFTACKAQDVLQNLTNSNETTPVITKKIDFLPTTTQPSLLSQIAGWIFPFGGSDNAPAESRDSPYYPAQQQQYHSEQQNCNPCNQAPWVPIATNYGHNTIVGFVQPQEFKNDHLYGQNMDQIRPPLPEGGYGGNFNDQSINLPQTHQSLPVYNDLGSLNQPTFNELGPVIPQNVEKFPLHKNKNNFGRQYLGHHTRTKKYHMPKFSERPYPLRPPPGNYRPPPLEVPNYSKISPQSHLNSAPPNYVPPSNYFPPKNIVPPQNNQHFNYGPPVNNPPPGNYGPPVNNPPPVNFGPPVNNPPPGNYGPPVNNPPPVNYGPPVNNIQPANYGPPPSSNYAPSNAFQQSQIPPSNFLPPQQHIPPNFNFNSHPIPLPNLSPGPVAPLHGPEPFKPEYQEPTNYNQGVESVQILKSVPVADYLASVEYPINIIRSPLLEVNVANATSQAEIPDDLRSLPHNDNYRNLNENQKLPESNFKDFHDNTRFNNAEPGFSNNPIIVEDTHVAASNSNHTYETDLKEDESVSGFYDGIHSGFINQILDSFGTEKVNEVTTEINPPIIEYNNWTPSKSLPTSMSPPPIGDSVWLKSLTKNEDDSKKPKQIQIIIPYTTNTKDVKVGNNIRTTLPLYTMPPTKESVWMEHSKTSLTPQKLRPIPSKSTTEVINIKDLFKDNKHENFNNLPFDIIRFQKNIDVWTEQEFSNKMLQHLNKENSAINNGHKNIPGDYFTTTIINEQEETTKPYFGDYEPAGSHSKEVTIKDEIETNSIISDQPTSTTKMYHANDKINKPSWGKVQVAVSPLTKEKVYVVTPLPKSDDKNSSRVPKENDLINTQTTFSISIKPMKNLTMEKDVKVVLSEWPHLINNLETTTSTTSKPSTSRHPLLGLMDLSSYAPPANSTIQTFSGHSKAILKSTVNIPHLTSIK